MLAIRCHNLVKRYDGKPPVEAVRGLDLAVEQGECFGLLGPNGAGKTTTIEILEGLLEATSGEVEVLGYHWGREPDEIRQRIGISLQETRLSEKLTVRETLTLFRSFYRQGITPEAAMARVSLYEKADCVGEESIRRTEAAAGGRVCPRRRSRTCCSSTSRPPASIPARADNCGISSASFVRSGKTVLLTTHYMDEAERLCDRVAIVDHGKLMALDTPRGLIASLGGEHIIEFTCTSPNGQPVDAASFAQLPGVSEARSEDGRVSLSVGEPHLVLPEILKRVRELGFELTSLTTRHASLEDVFVKLAGRHLTDDGQETK